jgi:restriction system protein
MAQTGSLPDHQQQHLESQQRTVDEMTAAVERQVKALDEMLTRALRLAPLSFESLMVSSATPRFDPGPLGLPLALPSWGDFAPIQPSRLGRFFRVGRHARQVAAARTRFEAAQSEHLRKESDRQRALAVAKARYDQEVTEERARAAKRNAYITDRQSAFAAGDAESVEWFVSCVLDASPYPKVFPRKHLVAYRPENRDVVVESELPPHPIVPSARAFRYVKSRDAIEPLPRPESEIKQRYQRLVSCVALRTLHEIFSATPPEVVEAVIFNGRVSTVDCATGRPIRPHLLSVSADRSAFDDLVLAAVEPVACLTHLNAMMSPDPFGLAAVQPFVVFDFKKFRFADDVTVGLDARPDLLKLAPSEFEQLVRQLFVAMGAEGWTAIPSREGIVGAVATSRNTFFGGLCFIQAKRWTGLVGVESVHALADAMSDHNAATGVLVTTSWFGRASEQLARRNRITLINGAELKQLIKEHLNKDVIAGASPPQLAGASGNLADEPPWPYR